MDVIIIIHGDKFLATTCIDWLTLRDPFVSNVWIGSDIHCAMLCLFQVLGLVRSPLDTLVAATRIG